MISHFPSTLAVWLGLALPALCSADVVFLPIPSDSAFPDATAPDALRFACAESVEELAGFFEKKALIFSPPLVAAREGHAACHIFYEPTVPGFRVAPENRPIRGLFVAVDPLSFIANRKPEGDSLSIAKQVLPQLPRPIAVTISVAGDFPSTLWPAALQHHFGESKHRLQVRQSGAQGSHPWAQDHQKAGEVEGQLRILVPRRLYEGRREDGDMFGPMLDKLDDPVYARSKLSWEGGDIQFVLHPKDPSKLIIVHGGAGRYYWGMGLTGAEASYVLVTEFGADIAVDLTPSTMHADYVVAFLPEDGIALVSQAVGNDPDLFRAAAGVLERICGKHPPPALLDLQRFLAAWDGDLVASASPLRGLIRGLDRAFQNYAYPEDPVLEEELTGFVGEHCDGKPETCFLGEGKGRMFAANPDLLRRSVNHSADIALFELGAVRMLGIMEAQLPRETARRELMLDGAARTFEDLGFRVIRVPYIYSPNLHDAWPGVAYVNSFVYERKIFMPAVGFGPLESAVFADVQQRIGRGYQVIPVNAWEALLNNGGAHCVFGIIREPARTWTASE